MDTQIFHNSAKDQDTPAEKWAARVIGTLAVVGMVWGLAGSLELFQSWPEVVNRLLNLVS